MACFPSGWRFVPTDQELINDYLLLKNHPRNAVPVTESFFSLPECDMYEADPWIVWEKRPYIKQDDYLCFTRLKKANSGGRINRRVGRSGTWSQGPNPKPIFDDDVDDNSALIGKKVTLRYEKMEEFSLDKSLKRKCDDHHLSQDFNSFLKNSPVDIFSAIDDMLLPGD